MNINDYINDYKLNKDKIILLDVRTEAEYIESHIDGGVNLPLQNIDEISNLYKDKKQIFYVYCRSGHRSSLAVTYMIKNGYINSINIGGIIDYNGEVCK